MSLRMTEDEYREWVRRQGNKTKPNANTVTNRKVPVLTFPEYEEHPKRRSKYGNRKIEIDGKKFDSQHEAAVYAALISRIKAGELKTVLRQVKFDLPGGIVYTADFVTIDNAMRVEGVYDAKSEATKKIRVYINKKKQMKAVWGIEIKEI